MPECLRPSCYSAMVNAVREWIENDHPEAEYATVIVEIGEGRPAIQIPILHPVEVVS